MEKSRKAEVTTQQIVIITILIISFVVILFFIFRLNPGETDSKQICQNSIVLAGKGSGLVGSIDCKTAYPVIGEEGRNETLKAIADEMASCWAIFGEGKIDYAGSGIFSNKACAICSIVKFDGKTQEKVPTVSYQELYDYLRTRQKSDSQSYLNYLYSVNNLSSFKDFNVTDYLSKKIDTSKEYFILTGMSKGPVWTFFGVSGNKHIPVTILEKTRENYDAVGCDEFITKA